MIIREVQVADAERFLTLLKEIDDSNRMLFNPGERQTSVEQQQKVLEQFAIDERSVFLVAEKAGEFLGYLGLISDDLERRNHIGRIVVGVSEKSRGQGIGTKLFESIFKWMEGKSFKRIELTVIKDNESAYRLYRKMGFEFEGEKVAALLIDGEFVNELYMHKLF
ncbi:GNAT family N-acetyltransferase [Viridibacillus sp. YIM B01967]|uniref:GNAT family N-acetyltransferase n=1 Tax=Viridibacillus soli TaxID=2798301 RepID=A0ABS1H5X8_9BACL|nr:GNAT family N-acetyltransferase [Viridibacillus soli]MBK3494699.1 GNAT family N-acetyltransferase [Viridibacillus soli]